MLDSALLDTTALKVWQAIDGMKLAFATHTSKSSAKRCWSVIARRAGRTLSVHLAGTPSTFAAMQWAKPIATVDLGKLPKGAEAELFRRVGAMRALPKSSRAIPLIFLEGGGTGKAASKHICSVALDKPLETRAVFRGETDVGDDSIEHCVFFGTDELIAVVTDLFIDGVFGKVAFRCPMKDLDSARVSEGHLALTIKGTTTTWLSAQPNPKQEIASIKALLKKKVKAS